MSQINYKGAVLTLKRLKRCLKKSQPSRLLRKGLQTFPDPNPEKKADSSTEQLLLILMKEVKGLKEQIKIPSDTTPSVSQSGCSKSSKGKQKTWEPYSTKTMKLFTKTQGTIFNQNNEVVIIAHRRIDVYVIDMSSYNKESNACFFAKASNSVNWLWQKRLSYLNFENINKLARQNLVAGLSSLTLSKD
ncbi:retrovirus-related pol polyprotein from transposon TNT 1-94 [Tanacetum coccineum]